MRWYAAGTSLTKSIAALSIVCLTAALAGCGDSDSSGDTGTTTNPAAGPVTTDQSGPQSTERKEQTAGQRESGAAEEQPVPIPEEPSNGSDEPTGRSDYQPDTSLQTFGDEVDGVLKKQVSRAVLSFFRALAKPNYPRICKGITRSNRQALEEYAQIKQEPEKSCAELLATLMTPPNAQIRQTAKSVITRVRVRKRETIVFFRPPGGTVSYIPMRREGGRWRSVTLAPGTPLDPAIGEP